MSSIPFDEEKLDTAAEVFKGFGHALVEMSIEINQALHFSQGLECFEHGDEMLYLVVV